MEKKDSVTYIDYNSLMYLYSNLWCKKIGEWDNDYTSKFNAIDQLDYRLNHLDYKKYTNYHGFYEEKPKSEIIFRETVFMYVDYLHRSIVGKKYNLYRLYETLSKSIDDILAYVCKTHNVKINTKEAYYILMRDITQWAMGSEHKIIPHKTITNISKYTLESVPEFAIDVIAKKYSKSKNEIEQKYIKKLNNPNYSPCYGNTSDYQMIQLISWRIFDYMEYINNCIPLEDRNAQVEEDLEQILENVIQYYCDTNICYILILFRNHSEYINDKENNIIHEGSLDYIRSIIIEEYVDNMKEYMTKRIKIWAKH